MRRGQIQHWPGGHNAGRVQRAVAFVVVALDVREVHGVRNAAVLIEIAHKRGQCRIVGDPAQIAFEVPDIDRVEADQRREEADVCFGQTVADQVALRRKAFLEPVERLEQRPHGFFIGILRGGEAALYTPLLTVS